MLRLTMRPFVRFLVLLLALAPVRSLTIESTSAYINCQGASSTCTDLCEKTSRETGAKRVRDRVPCPRPPPTRCRERARIAWPPSHRIIKSSALTGTIPSEMGQLTALTRVYAQCTPFEGRHSSRALSAPLSGARACPASHARAPAAAACNRLAWDNQLIGTIPSELGQATKLTSLYVVRPPARPLARASPTPPRQAYGLAYALRAQYADASVRTRWLRRTHVWSAAWVGGCFRFTACHRTVMRAAIRSLARSRSSWARSRPLSCCTPRRTAANSREPPSSVLSSSSLHGCARPALRLTQPALTHPSRPRVCTRAIVLSTPIKYPARSRPNWASFRCFSSCTPRRIAATVSREAAPSIPLFPPRARARPLAPR